MASMPEKRQLSIKRPREALNDDEHEEDNFQIILAQNDAIDTKRRAKAARLQQQKGAKSSRVKRAKVEWWKSGVVYQVYPRSFCDTTGDGIGDLKGISSKLSYLAELGVAAVWLSPIFKSPMADFGYDISDFTAVDPIFGTMNDFENLVTDAHALGLKIVMDLVANHSSSEHEWFKKSIEGEDPYADYYVWHKPKDYDEAGKPLPPNNWLSVFGGSAWTWNPVRKEFYYHQFLPQQPDLNYRNILVQQEMENVLKFWLDKGVDGVRVDAIKHLFEVEDPNQDEPLSGDPGVEDPEEYGYLEHPYTTDLPETFGVLRQWKGVMNQYPGSKVLMAEVYYDSMEAVMQYYGSEQDPLADFPFNFNFIQDFKSRTDVRGVTLKAAIDRWMDSMPSGKWPNWLLGNHDTGRAATRFGADLCDALNMIVLLLPGTAITYYGEEIGMEDTPLSFEDTKDPAGLRWGPERYKEFSRDPSRTPMQWDGSAAAAGGFSSSSSSPWLPINEGHVTTNVSGQGSAAQSSLKVYKSLVQLRKMAAFSSGALAFPVVTEQIFSFVRHAPDEAQYLLVVNTGTHPTIADLLHHPDYALPLEGTVVLRSSTDTRDATEPRTALKLDKVPLLGGEGLVLKLADKGTKVADKTNKMADKGHKMADRGDKMADKGTKR